MSLKIHLLDASLSLNKIENDLWLRLVELKCPSNTIQQIRSNQRNYLVSINDQIQRQVRNKIYRRDIVFIGFF